MRFIHAITISTLAGSVASAQPVARHLIDDADVVEVLFSEVGGPNATPWASLHILDDLDADGVRDVLVTHQKPLADGARGAEDYFRAFVRSSRSGGELLHFPNDETDGIQGAHAAAVMIDDINGDGVRDIAVGRTRLSLGAIGLRVHSGVTGEVLRAPFADDFLFSFGVSMIPWVDMDGDGQPDLLLGSLRRGSNFPFAYWSPGSGAFTSFRPADYPTGSMSINGYTLLDLGVGASGAREVLTTIVPEAFGGGSDFAMLGGDPLRTTARTFDTPAFGAVRLKDMGDDGHDDVVVAGLWPVPDAPPLTFGVPVFSGELPGDPFATLIPSAIHEPRMVVDFGQGAQIVRPYASRAIAPLGDATGDGFPDYAFLGGFEGLDFSGEHIALVAVCGRTGTAFFAAEQQNSQGTLTPVFPTTSIYVATSYLRGRDAMVSPGDVNDDGAPDLLMLVQRINSGDGSDDQIREQLLLTHYLPTPCVGDVDFDRVVDFADLNAVLSNFGAADITLPADLNASGVVDFADLNLVLSAFGVSCD